MINLLDYLYIANFKYALTVTDPGNHHLNLVFLLVIRLRIHHHSPHRCLSSRIDDAFSWAALQPAYTCHNTNRLQALSVNKNGTNINVNMNIIFYGLTVSFGFKQ